MSKELLWYVIPCGGVINVEIRQKKHVIIAKHKLSHYRVYNLSNVSGGERYVMKIWDESQYEIPEFSRVEVRILFSYFRRLKGEGVKLSLAPLI